MARKPSRLVAEWRDGHTIYEVCPLSSVADANWEPAVRFECSHCRGILEIGEWEPGEAVACGHCGSAVAVPDSRLSPGALVGDFVLREELGRGGMGTVFLAHQVSLDRNAAVKVLHDEFAADEQYLANFVREARAAANLNHPGIVQAYAVGEDEGLYYFAMEYVAGSTLKDVLLHSGRMVPERALEIVTDVAEALHFGWKNQHLVHRDIKPDNIMLTGTGTVKLADLGLARWGADTAEGSGEVHGTPQYISPEQLLGQPAEIGADIYSLGATLYHMVSGQFPYQGKDALEIAEKHLFAPLPPVGSVVAGLPPAVCQVIEVMLAKRPAHRYRDTTELIADLRRVAAGEMPLRCPAEGAQVPVDLDEGLAVGDGGPAPAGAVPSAGKRRGAIKLRPTKSRSKAVPAEEVEEEIEPELPGEEEGAEAMAAGLEDEESGAGRPKWLVPALVLLVLLVAGTAVFLLFFSPAAEDGPTAAGVERVSPGESETGELAAVRNMVASGAGSAEVATALAEYASGRDLSALEDGFWELAGPLVEEDLARVRGEARENEQAAWQAEHEKLAAAAAARRAEAERRAAEEAKRQAEEAARREAAERQAAAAAEWAARQDQLRWEAVERCRANDYRGARNLFAPLLNDPRPEVAAWATDKQACVELAESLFDRVRNSQRKLAGAQLPVPQSRRRWTVTFVGIRTIEAEMTVTVYEQGEGRQETRRVSMPLDEVDEQIFFHLISHLATVDETVEAERLRLEFGAFLVSRARYLEDARRRLTGLPGTEAMLAEIGILARGAGN